MNLARHHYDSPVGRLTLVADPSGLRAVLWPDDPPSRTRLEPTPVAGPVGDGGQSDPDDLLDDVARQLDEYFAGTRTRFDVPLAPHGTAFQLRVWEVLRSIDYGTTMTYGEQARLLGDPKLARAVGAANGRNPISIVVPCHRVTGSGGRLTGFAGGLEAKQWLLDHERGRGA